LFICTDQQSASMMSCTGNPWLNTPAMDSLAQRGTRFDHAYAAVPVCLPARTCLHTGHMSSEFNIRDNRCRRDDQVVPPELLKRGQGWLLQEAGYRALYGGKEHFPKYRAEDIGFEDITRDERDDLAAACADFLAQPAGDKPFALMCHLINPHDICYMAIRDAATSENEARIMKNASIEIEELDKALQHPSGVSDAEFFETHCPPLPDNFGPQADEPEAFQELMDERPFRRNARENWSAERWREHRWAYARLTERVDLQIGRILDALNESPHADNTIVIFTSDHGDMDSAHGFEHKTLFYDEAARIPLIVAGPGVPQGKVDDQHVISNGLDLLPTLCDYAGAPVPDDLWGTSIRPLLEGGSWSRDYVPIVNQIGHAVVSRSHKYCVFDRGENAEQLYDRVNDPGEMRNALNDPDQAETLAQHRAWYREYWSARPAD
jgi:arylsulfatase A-like enzyme